MQTAHTPSRSRAAQPEWIALPPDTAEVVDRLAADLMSHRASSYHIRPRLAGIANRIGPDSLYVMRDCRRLIGRADVFRNSKFIVAMSDRRTPQERKKIISAMYEAVFCVGRKEADAAVDKARETDVKKMFDILAMDAVVAASYIVAMSGVVRVGAAGVAATTSAMSAASSAGTIAGKAKAVLWGGATLGVAGAALGAALLMTNMTGQMLESNTLERREAFATELGKDLLLVEMITGNRYKQHYVLMDARQADAMDNHREPVHMGGFHGTINR